MTNYRRVLEEVECVSPSVTLVSVSKTHPYNVIEEAYEEGARIFGENRVQEIEAKFPPLSDRPDGMKVYLIGQLQRNKVKKAVSLVDRIESVDSLKLAQKIEDECAQAGKRIEVLLEYNSSGEEQKTGFRTPEELLSTASFIKENAPHLILRGLMTVGPLGFDSEKNIKAFTGAEAVFRDMAEYIEGEGVLSMGMSADWKDAIRCGSTEVRIGSAIFGERDYSKDK